MVNMLKFINYILRFLFFAIIVRFVVLIILGLNIRRRENLPAKAPAIIVANHNSHLDTLVLISLFPLSLLSRIHPVAAADYFLKNKFLAWFATNIIGIIPISRTGHQLGSDPLLPCYEALDKDQILILFPEGTRGEPEQLSTFKKGIAYLAEKYPQVPITPIFMHGLGKALPKGKFLFVPFFCDIFVGKEIFWNGDKQAFMQLLNDEFDKLSHEEHFPEWE